MKLTPLGEMELTYVGPIVLVAYGVGGQYYADMEGTWRSDRINGNLRLTNIAQKRPDNVNTPNLRGTLETEDGATMFVEMNGLSQIQEGGRVFVTSLTLRTANPDYQWVNTLFAVVEGELHGLPRPNELRARCRVFACEATINSVPEGGDLSMRVIAYALPLRPGTEVELQALARELESRSAEFEQLRRYEGIKRESGFLQRGPQGSQLIIYREFDDSSSATQPISDGSFGSWLNERMSALQGVDQSATGQPKVELLIRQRRPRPSQVYAAAVPLAPNKIGRLHEWTLELNGIHAGEFEEAMHRLGHAVTLFVQHTPQLDLLISVVEGDDAPGALGKLATSDHPFDRWHYQQIADLTGLDFSGPPPPPNEELWAWESGEVRATAG